MKIRMEKMMRLHLLFLLVPWLCLMVLPVWATTAYVTDFFEITLRTGPSIENKITTMIPTGQPVEILNSTEGWNHVRLLNSKKGNKEGWVLSRFLVDHPPWKTQVRSIKEELALSERKLSEALRRERDIRRRLNAMQKDVQRLTEENQQVKSSQQYKWFARGALVLLCGLILGLLIGRKHRSKVFY